MQTAQQIGKEQYQGLRDAKVLYNPENVFEYNVEMLVARGIGTYDDADPFRKAIPHRFFLWIPARPREMDLTHLMSLVVTNGNPGVNYIGRECCWNTVEIPAGPYLALNIRDGNERLGVNNAESRADITREHRSPHTLFESIIHSILYPIVFATHNLNVGGSDCESERLLNLSLDHDMINLRIALFDFANRRWGVPSCGKRLDA